MNIYFIKLIKSFYKHILPYLILCSCTPFPNILQLEPLNVRESNSIIVIGCIIIEPYTCNNYGPYQVQLGYSPFNSDSEYMDHVWTVTDSLGYFALPNMPEGNYMLKGVRIWRPDKPHVVNGPTIKPVIISRQMDIYLIYSDYNLSEQARRRIEAIRGPDYVKERWIKFPDEPLITPIVRPLLWQFQTVEKVLNFEYTVLTLDERYEGPGPWEDVVHSYHFKELKGEQFILSQPYFRPSVNRYFANKYPNSEWALLLKR